MEVQKYYDDHKCVLEEQEAFNGLLKLYTCYTENECPAVIKIGLVVSNI